jgi:hypothetical protein
MATTHIEAVRRLHLVPLVNIQHPVFARHYEDGLAHSFFGDHETPGPLHDLYLVDIFLLARRFQRFDGHHEQELYGQIGFTLGEIHGGVLRSDGTLRPDVTTLVTLHDPEIKRGYAAGRDFFFLDADTEDAWHMSDDTFIGLIRELAEEYADYADPLGTVRFSIGCRLGELSGHLFPWTPREQHSYETESMRFLGSIETLKPACIVACQCSLQAVS